MHPPRGLSGVPAIFISKPPICRKNEDIFVHHSAITVKGDQYRYLVQGEYIEFHLQKSNDLTHPYQAASVRGIGGGALMCETHFELKKNRFKTDKNTLV